MKEIYMTFYNYGIGAMSGQLTFEDQVAKAKEMGFDGAEIFAPFTDETVAILEKYGMNTMEARAKWGDNGELMYIDQMQKCGIKYISGAEGYYDRESALRTAEELNELGRKLKPYGFKADSHNHTGEFLFNEQDGEYLWETVAKNTDPDLVCFKMDIGWSTIAGIDSSYLIAKYPGRTELIHIKPATAILGPEAMNMGAQQRRPRPAPGKNPMDDPEMKKMMERMQEINRKSQGKMCDFVRDLREILVTAEKYGAKSFILERDGFYMEDRIAVMTEDLAYLREIWN